MKFYAEQGYIVKDNKCFPLTMTSLVAADNQGSHSVSTSEVSRDQSTCGNEANGPHFFHAWNNLQTAGNNHHSATIINRYCDMHLKQPAITS